MRKTMAVAVLIASILTAGVAQAGPTREQKCEAGKNSAAGKYAACRQKVVAKSLLKGLSPDYSKCDATFNAKFPATEAKAGPLVCPSEGDVADIQALLTDCSDDVSTALSGGGLPPVCGNGVVETGEGCDIDSMNGQSCASQGFAGGTLACAAGCMLDTSACYANRFDASGPTIIDNETGLEWEKKTTVVGDGPNYADPHDVDNTHNWCVGVFPNCANPDNPFDGTAATDLLANLNGGNTGVCYAAHCDWRLPTIEELETIAVPGCDFPPCVVDAVFAPTPPTFVWSASTVASAPGNAWYLSFGFGVRNSAVKTNGNYIRAVRGGS